MRPVRRQSSQVFEDRRDGLPEALSLSAAPGFHNDDIGMVPAFNMLGRGNRLHAEGFGMMQNLVDPSSGWGYALQCNPTVRAGGKSRRRVRPFFLTKQRSIKPSIGGDG
jgi:hypothetical protein